MSEVRFMIRTWVDSNTNNNVLTLRGLTSEQADRIINCLDELLPESIYRRDGGRALYLYEPELIVHHYFQTGGEVELMSHSLTHEALMDFIPSEQRQMARVIKKTRCSGVGIPGSVSSGLPLVYKKGVSSTGDAPAIMVLSATSVPSRSSAT